MSVLTLNTSVTYISTGSVGPYAFNFPISTAAALTVSVNGTVQAPTGFTAIPVNNNFDNGGSITFNTAPTAGQSVVIKRTTPLTQTSQFYDNLPQPMQQFEDALDKLTEIVQELAANQSGSGGGSTVTVFEGVLNGTVDGSNKVFTLTNNGTNLPSSPTQAFVWDNYLMTPGVGYTLSGIVVTFTIAPSVGDIPTAQGFTIT